MRRETLLQFVTLGLLLWLCFFVHSCAAGDPHNRVPEAKEITGAPVVQVGLTDCLRQDEVRLRIRGECRIGSEPLDAFDGKITATEHGLRLGELEFDIDQVRIRSVGDASTEIWVLDKKKARVPRPYAGEFLILKDRGKVTIVNEVDLEQYVLGVLGSEMPLYWSEEALKAQAIAARTYAMCEVKNARLRKINGERFDLYDDVRSQVYKGLDTATKKAKKVIEATKGMFVVWKEKLVNTFFSSTCGGNTDAAWKMIGEGSRIRPLMGVKCGFCTASPVYEWSVGFDRIEMAKKLFENEPGMRVESVRVLESLPGGHAVKVSVKLEGHDKARVLHGNREFRRRLRMKSSLFVKIEEKGGRIQVTGRGWGHGSGMCQWGAQGMAKAGKSGIEVLEYYYPEAKVKKLY